MKPNIFNRHLILEYGIEYDIVLFQCPIISKKIKNTRYFNRCFWDIICKATSTSSATVARAWLS